MELKKLSDRVYYYPNQSETDRPMLAYLKGEKIAAAIDAGGSKAHVEEFYLALEAAGLRRPDFTIITHWHWDHTFGMHSIHGLSVAHKITDKYLNRERERLKDSSYSDFLKRDDICLGREYENQKEIVVVQADIEFEKNVTLCLGGLTASAFHAVSPHSEDTVLIYVPEEGILFLGDATSEDFYCDGYMDRGKLRALMDIIEGIDCRYCVLSHTEPLRKEDLLAYLDTIV